jgi:hypothetical protein
MAAAHRPLLVIHRAVDQYRVYDIYIEDEQRLDVHPLPEPVVDPLHYRPLAVSSGGTILGVTPQLTTAPGVRDTGPPIMLAVGDDDTVVRMDTVVYGDSSRFEMLRPLAGGGWCTTPLPRPPFRTLRLPLHSVSITAYFAMGTRVWISVTGEGTFSLDTQVGTWRMEFPEELRRLEGRAFFVPELGSVVGLTAGDDKFLCSYKFNDGETEKGVPLTWQHTWSEAVPWECSDRGYSLIKEKASLAYLGGCRFCVYRPVKVLGTFFDFNTYLVLDLRRRSPDGKELEIARRGKVNYRGMLPKGLFHSTFFIQ